jgi:hypothetical protein
VTLAIVLPLQTVLARLGVGEVPRFLVSLAVLVAVVNWMRTDRPE